ncbi:MAG TPA: hypothetical protein VMS93_00590 [Candidatus Saccharimonadales bacterium]|nr:hypothetical protein [Candidatus Saccharimonadales bacterium]
MTPPAFRSAAVIALVALALLWSGPLAAPAAAGALDMLARLQEIPALSGCEDSLRAALTAELPGWSRPEVDALGDLVVDCGGQGPVRLLAAPLDEPGYVVTAIDTLGYLRLARLGGAGRLFDQFQVGQRFRVLTARGPLPAVSVAPSTHLRRAPVGEPLGVNDLWLDAGMRSGTEAGRAGIRLLDPVSPVERCTRLAGLRLAGPGLEGRAEAVALLRALMGEKPAGRGHWVAAFTAQAQPGGRGLRRLVRRFQPAEVYLLGGFPKARAGLGPALQADSLRGLDAGLTQSLARLGGKGVQRQGPGLAPDRAGLDPLDSARVAVLGLPVRYARTPVETVDAGDVEALAALLRKLLEAP